VLVHPQEEEPSPRVSPRLSWLRKWWRSMFWQRKVLAAPPGLATARPLTHCVYPNSGYCAEANTPASSACFQAVCQSVNCLDYERCQDFKHTIFLSFKLMCTSPETYCSLVNSPLFSPRLIFPRAVPASSERRHDRRTIATEYVCMIQHSYTLDTPDI
jgi:hypothetical protein